ncbi:restriction endonuclease [Paenibacillus polymyxa]|uniref:restriction endonuclease n=1 Tax=Paenibacillus polymyxa TaxID=1406 RepID=UPI000C9FC7C8|nr:restriction endonuclease [Paenibacillus polymyxa]PNQ84217.1 restriction endonuclease [Paenibacillus polymyxa]QDA28245.1 restriction endonuclease [Paenibacillus polymyxa]RTZ37192.1 restriction endonuclease [Paenibacillus polymyxa]
MARTYYAEGRQVAYVLRGLFIIVGLTIYFKIPGLHWGYLFGILLGSVILGEIFGSMWTRKQRQKKKSKATGTKKTGRSRTASTNNGVSKAKGKITSKKLTDAQILQANVDTLSGTDFERLMELYYTDQGYSVQRVGGSGDHEVDLILKGKEGYKIAVQCKRWKRDVGNDIVLRLKAGKQVHGCYDAWIVTTSNFTRAAKEAAERLNIKLINGVALADRLKRWKKNHVI